MIITIYNQSIFILLFISSNVIGNSMTRIIGGSDAQDNAYPYQASLRVVGRHICGGSILNNYWILTAAHCLVKYEASKITVVIGSNYLMFGGIAYRSAFTYVYPYYNKAEHVHDIGVLMVDGVIEFTEAIQPITLPTQDIYQGDCVLSIFTGWGNTYTDQSNTGKLQMIQLCVIKLSACQKIFAQVGKTHLCTFNETGEGVCYGDSGGPLVTDGTQIGIASWGSPCGQGYPDVFTRVYFYVDWIKSITLSIPRI